MAEGRKMDSAAWPPLKEAFVEDVLPCSAHESGVSLAAARWETYSPKQLPFFPLLP